MQAVLQMLCTSQSIAPNNCTSPICFPLRSVNCPQTKQRETKKSLLWEGSKPSSKTSVFLEKNPGILEFWFTRNLPKQRLLKSFQAPQVRDAAAESDKIDLCCFGSKGSLCRNIFYIKTWVEEMYSFLSCNYQFGLGPKIPSKTTLGYSKSSTFAWSCQMKQEALRDHEGSWWLHNYTSEFSHHLCRPKRKGSSEWKFPLIRRLISFVRVGKRFEILSSSSSSSPPSSWSPSSCWRWSPKNLAYGPTLFFWRKSIPSEKGKFSNPNILNGFWGGHGWQLVRPESRISAVNKRSGRSYGGPWKVSWFDSSYEELTFEGKDSKTIPDSISSSLQWLNGKWGICNTIIFIYHEVILHWRILMRGREQTRIIPQSMHNFSMFCHKSSLFFDMSQPVRSRPMRLLAFVGRGSTQRCRKCHQWGVFWAAWKDWATWKEYHCKLGSSRV